jgi:predicted MPP superfamily phosphohydrolase
MKNTIKAALIAGGAAALAGLTALAISEKPKIVPYVITTDKVTKPIRLLHVSDLHSSAYGKGQRKLIELTDAIAPDAILMTGDIADNRVPNHNAFTYTAAVGDRYPCFYVTGNHEFYTGCVEELRQILAAHGLTLLEGESATFATKGGNLTICGVDDPYGFPDKKKRFWEEQLADCNAAIQEDRFAILLTHRPEIVDYYAETAFDLILAGHAHGGQVILPKLVNGLYAPHQGLFPSYAGGRYELRKGQTMIVSRGLSKYVRPRVFNRPELVLLTLLPQK